MEFKDNLFTYEIISDQDMTVRVKYGAGLFGNETLYYSKKSDIPTNDSIISIPDRVGFDGKTYTVVEVGKDLFHDLISMDTLRLPNTIRHFNWCLWECFGLKNIEVDSSNENYASVDGVLFSKGLKSLVAYPVGRNGKYVVPNGTAKIESFAFKTALLSELELPESLLAIENNVFYRCSNLKRVLLPDNVKHIGSMGDTRMAFVYKGHEYSPDEIHKILNEDDC